MLVQDLAPECLVPVEVADDVLRVLGDVEELLLLRDLLVFAVAVLTPGGALLLHALHGLTEQENSSQFLE